MTLHFALAGLAALAISADPGPHLEIRPGLWETKNTVSTKVEGDVPQMDLSKLTPEQRARIEAARARRLSGKPHTSVHQFCVSEEDIKKGFKFEDAEKDDDCERKYLDRTPKHVRFEMKCQTTGKFAVKTEGSFEMTVKSADLVVAHGKMKAQSAGRDSDTEFDLEARRLGSSCGDLKPGESRAVSE